jgi:hypothetical protein
MTDPARRQHKRKSGSKSHFKLILPLRRRYQTASAGSKNETAIKTNHREYTIHAGQMK